MQAARKSFVIMSINSRAKGARGERLFRDLLKSHGFSARRGQQYSGSPDSPDVVSDMVDIHWEVKFVENLNLAAAYEQAKTDHKEGTIPIVAHKKSRGDWMVTLDANHFIEIYKAWKTAIKHTKN